MLKNMNHDVDPIETREWLESLDEVLQRGGPERAEHLLRVLHDRAAAGGAEPPFARNTAYVNTIAPHEQPAYPGDRALERRIKGLVRWNALMMVYKAKQGGHMATFQSSATLYEVGYNHFFRGPDAPGGGDMVYYQGHASPGMYSRAFLEKRLSAEKLSNFRKELAAGGGLSSYPHPWLMPDFWQFPTVSMGLGPIASIYHARYLRYLEDRGLKDTSKQRCWSFIGDGECDEVETLGAIHLASRDNLDNLIWVVNCNLQRLDGPVRGNGKIVQELEGFFRGAGWNVVKLVWGADWDPLIAKDSTGKLVRRLEEVPDGDWQKYVVSDGEYFLGHFCNGDADLRKIFDGIPVAGVHRLRRGGHDPEKVYAAYDVATKSLGRPTVVLAQTVKGYGMGDAGEGFNTAHQIKGDKWKDPVATLRNFRDRFEIPVPDSELADFPFFHPGEDSPEFQYAMARRRALGGSIPCRKDPKIALPVPTLPQMGRLLESTESKKEPAVSTTFMFVQTLGELLRHQELGKHIVPIVPDEARTFGMEAMMSSYGIYSPHGMNYTPVDSGALGAYRESRTGQCFEEGINEAGAMANFIAIGSSYANHGVPMVPFYIYYSMFGFQRVGDLIWLAGDQRVRGFLLGATAGRTTLNGEGLQHQDGHGHLMAAAIPNMVAYDPTFGYELATIVRDGLRRMYGEHEDVFYYITVYNEAYPMPAMPAGSEAGILKGAYLFRRQDAAKPAAKSRPRLLGSGPILPVCVLKAQTILAERYGVATDAYSVTSFKELRREALEADRWNLLHPDQPARRSYVAELLGDGAAPTIAATDNVRAVPEMIQPWVPHYTVLGTDGFGRSETRVNLRRHFEIDAEFVVLATLKALADRNELPRAVVAQAIKDLGIDAEKLNPLTG